MEIVEADWAGFEAVMGPKGGCGGCWCMLWRLPKAEFEAGQGDGNRAAMREIFEAGPPPGLIAREGGRPLGWVQIAPREALPRIARSRVMRPVDDLPAWIVTCFLVDKTRRRQGLSAALLEGAAQMAARRGAPALDGFPIDTPKEKYPPVYAWTGFVGAFRAAGFTEIARPTPTRPVMRRMLG